MRIVDISGLAFSKLIRDEKILDLLNIPEPRDVKAIRKHIVNDAYPDDLVKSKISRICVYEATSSMIPSSSIETCYLEFDIYVHKDVNQFDKKILQIANRINELFKDKYIEDYKIHYYRRLGNPKTSSDDWVKYGMVYMYNNIVV